jgi:DNA end-binding protein Ku
MPRKSASKPNLPQRGRKQTVAFGLVNVPVQLKPLVDPAKPVSGNYICAAHQHKVKTKKVCDFTEGKEHDVEDAVIAYPFGDQFVTVDPDAVDALVAEKTGELRIERVVPVYDIDPLYFGKAYLVYPGEGGATVFDLFRAALQESGMAAVCNAILGKQTEMLVLRWSVDTETLLAHGCHYESYVRWEDVEKVQQDAAARPAPAAAQVKLAQDFLDALKGDFDPTAVEDQYFPALQQLIEQTAAGKPVVTAVSPSVTAEPADDLMSALRASVQQAKQSKPASKKAAKKPVAA